MAHRSISLLGVHCRLCIATLIALAIVECGATPAVYVTILSNLSHVGDNITVQCRIVGVPDLRPRVSWVKTPVGDAHNGLQQTIAEDVQVVEPYDRLGRYFPSLAPLSHVTLYTLTIYLLQHADSGRIRCVLPDVDHYDDEEDSVVLQVFKRPSRLYFVGYENADELTLTEENPVFLQCAARNVLPLPRFRVSVRNHSVIHHDHHLHQLAPNATVNVHCGRQGSSSVCTGVPVHYDLDAVLTVPGLVVRHRDDGHYLTCSASLPNSNWTPSLTSVRLNVRYRPRFHCHRSHKARLHASDVSIECVLRHNPTPSQLYVTWYHHGGSRRVDDGDTGDDYRLLTSTVSEKETCMTFIIGRVKSHDFGSYAFHAVNDVGHTSHEVRLTHDQSPTRSSSTGGAVTQRHPTASPVPAGGDTSSASSSSLSNRLTSHLRVCLVLLCWLVDVHSVDKLAQLVLSTHLL